MPTPIFCCPKFVRFCQLNNADVCLFLTFIQMLHLWFTSSHIGADLQCAVPTNLFDELAPEFIVHIHQCHLPLLSHMLEIFKCHFSHDSSFPEVKSSSQRWHTTFGDQVHPSKMKAFDFLESFWCSCTVFKCQPLWLHNCWSFHAVFWWRFTKRKCHLSSHHSPNCSMCVWQPMQQGQQWQIWQC